MFAAIFLVPGLLLGILAFGIILLMLGNARLDPGAAAAGMGCSGLLGVLAVVCLIQGFRELGGRTRKSSDADEFAVDVLDGEFTELVRSVRSFERLRPPLVPKEQAESLVRTIAEKHGAEGILRRLGHFQANHLANAAATFAREMSDEETPLAFIDASFLGNGKAGILLTNRGLYSSFYRRPFWLANIEEVSYIKPSRSLVILVSLLAFVVLFAHCLPLGVVRYLVDICVGFFLLLEGPRLRYQLLINGKVVYKRRLRGGFWIELLTELAAAARQAQPSSDSTSVAPSLVVLETSLAPRSGQPVEIRRIRDPVWQQIEQSIRDLDQDSYPSLRIWTGEPDQAAALEILGGNGKYVVRELGDGWTYYDPSQGEEEIEVCTGDPGQRCPAFYVCTDLRRVLEIARHYFETGTPE